MSKLDELIGKLCPNGIKFSTLGQSCTLVTGATPSKAKSEYWENGTIPWMSSGEVNNRFIFETEAKISQKGYDNTSTTIVPTHSIVIALAGQGKTRGKVAITEIELCTNQSLCSIICGDELYYKFLYYYLDSKYWDLRAISNGDGSRGGLSLRLLSPYTIPIPPLEVQEEIVQILDEYSEKNAQLIDVLKAELEARKVQYEYYRSMLFSFDRMALSGPVEQMTIGDIGKISMCKRVLKSQTSDEGEIPFYKIGTFGRQANAFITKELFEEYKSKYSYPNKGDILISASGTIGRTVVFDGEPAYFQDSNIVWVANDESKVTNAYLQLYYKTSPWKPREGGTITRLYNDIIESTPIAVPSKDDQANMVEKFGCLEETYTEYFDNLENEITLRQTQYEYYRDKLLTFEEAN